MHCLLFPVACIKAMELYNEHPKEAFLDDMAAHLGNPLHPFGEDDGDLLELKTELFGRKLHLNLECVSYKAYFVEVNGFEHLALKAHKAGGGIANVHPGKHIYIPRAELGNQYAVPGPVYKAAALYIARTNGQIVTIFGANLIKPHQIVGIMAEIAVHFKDVLVGSIERPSKACNISGAKP